MHLDVLVATDFFTAEVWTTVGLVTYYVLFFLHLDRPTHAPEAYTVLSAPILRELQERERDILLLPELATPLPDGFVRHNDPTNEQEFFHITMAQRKAKIQPDGVADDLPGNR
jgi:hypothetical protein